MVAFSAVSASDPVPLADELREVTHAAQPKITSLPVELAGVPMMLDELPDTVGVPVMLDAGAETVTGRVATSKFPPPRQLVSVDKLMV